MRMLEREKRKKAKRERRNKSAMGEMAAAVEKGYSSPSKKSPIGEFDGTMAASKQVTCTDVLFVFLKIFLLVSNA